MAARRSRILRRALAWAMFLVLVASVVIWYVTRDTLPAEISVATGVRGGLYYQFGQSLAGALERRTGRPVRLVETDGSDENLQRLSSRQRANRVDLALAQAEFVSPDSADVIAPLYPEPVHVIVRKDRHIEKISDLAGKKVALGPEASGMRRTALRLLQHYEINPSELAENELYFKELLRRPSLDAAIVTAGVENPDLQEVLGSKQFELLPIADAKAIEMVDPSLRYFELPRGLYAEDPPVPSSRIPTVATTAFLVAGRGASDALVKAALTAIHEEGVGLPTLIPREEAMKWARMRLHPQGRAFFDPYDQMGWLANVMESLAATKELLFAFGAAMYLLWHRWRRSKERQREKLIRAQKEHLDRFLEETLRVESALIDGGDPQRLQAFLDEVTRIKLRALHEFTEEELRGDLAFSILLTQCANLISSIHLRIITHASGSPDEPSLSRSPPGLNPWDNPDTGTRPVGPYRRESPPSR